MQAIMCVLCKAMWHRDPDPALPKGDIGESGTGSSKWTAYEFHVM
jgi:hypothetical protein